MAHTAAHRVCTHTVHTRSAYYRPASDATSWPGVNWCVINWRLIALMRCRPRLSVVYPLSHPRHLPHPPSTSSTVLLLFCIRIVSIQHTLARAQTNWWEKERERTKTDPAEYEPEREHERAFKSGGLSPIFIIHSSLNLFRFLPRFSRLRAPTPLIYLRSFSMSLIAFQKQCGSTPRLCYFWHVSMTFSPFSFRFRFPFMPLQIARNNERQCFLKV